ncbi:MAG: redoxin domain-containing protein, partial [Maribacter sp.]
ISPQKPDDALTALEKNDLGFEVLSDVTQKVIKSYNLQFDPGEDYHKRRDLTLLNGDGLKTLPVPATFIVNTKRIIEAAHVEANYTQRMGAAEILKVLENISF